MGANISKLLFSDEFNNSTLSTKIWDTQYDWGPNTIINNELEYYVNIAKDGTTLSKGYNPFVEKGGTLTISANPAAVGSSNSQPFDSGVITTQHSFSFQYGYAEIRAKLPAGPGTWPAFWMDQKNLVWPPELDVMEEIGQNPHQYVGTVHSGTVNTMQQVSASTPDLSKYYHVYGVDWEPDKITWYFDNGVVGQVATPPDLKNPMYLMANLAIGGSWPGPSTDMSQFPAQYSIDYIRVWDHKPDPSQDGVTLKYNNDTLKLALSEDAWQGDAQCLITIDGQQLGGPVTVTALHGHGQPQVVAFTGTWGPGVHDIGVQFINDAWGGTAATDRNLYVNAVTLDGQAPATASATLWSNGTAHFTTAASPLVLQLSEDVYQGDAQFGVAVDGQTLGGAQSVTTLHASGASQNFAFGLTMTAGTHDIAVSFLNDAWGGTAASDRNLYIDGISINGVAVSEATATLLTTSTHHFSVVIPASG